MGLKLLGEKSKTFLRLAEEEEGEEEGAGKTVQVCARGSSSCCRFRALSLPRQGRVGEPARLSQGVEEGCGVATGAKTGSRGGHRGKSLW